jgi:hypothetical protein
LIVIPGTQWDQQLSRNFLMPRDEDFRIGPPSKKRVLSGRRRDEDEYDDDRPRRRRQAESSNVGLWIGLGVGGGLLLVGVIVLVIVLTSRSQPEQVVVQFGDGPKIPIQIPKDFPNPFPDGKIPNPKDFFPDGKFPFPDGKMPFPNPKDFPNPFQGGMDQRAAMVIPGDRFVFIQKAVNEKRLADVNVTGFMLGSAISRGAAGRRLAGWFPGRSGEIFRQLDGQRPETDLPHQSR